MSTASTARKIVSLLPSATEIVCALGLRDRLVGRSHECDFPPGVEELPVCTAPRFEVEGSSREIDERVGDLVAKALSVYEVDEDLLARLGPDLIVTQSQCEVCAVSLDDVEQAVARGLGSEVRVVSLDASSVAGIWDDMARVAEAAGVAADGDRVVTELRERVAVTARDCAATDEKPSVVCLEWLDPLMTAGNWMPELVRLAGGTSALARDGEHSGRVEWREVVEADPDVIILLPCGFDMARTRSELHLLTDRPEWALLRAVRGGRVFVTDGNQYFNRPGPRIVDSLEILAEMLHPGVFEPAYGERAWSRIGPPS